MFTLYARPGSGSAAIEALLEEVGAEYRVEDVERLPDRSFPASYLKLNPLGQVPSLKLVDDSIMTESAAMMIYIADLFPKAGLAPAPDSPQRATYLRWMLYFASAVYMADLRYFYPERYSTDVADAQAIKDRALQHMTRDFAHFAKSLAEGPYILGDTFSAVDIYAAMLVGWVPDCAELFETHPNIKRHYNAVGKRAKIAPIWHRNKMPQ
jgi:glutathione S-transferase